MPGQWGPNYLRLLCSLDERGHLLICFSPLSPQALASQLHIPLPGTSGRGGPALLPLPFLFPPRRFPRGIGYDKLACAMRVLHLRVHGLFY